MSFGQSWTAACLIETSGGCASATMPGSRTAPSAAPFGSASNPTSGRSETSASTNAFGWSVEQPRRAGRGGDAGLGEAEVGDGAGHFVFVWCWSMALFAVASMACGLVMLGSSVSCAGCLC